ncbi:MAG: hypothetical protein JST92_07355 [Deltaproteobacteria bacterium]|nr:hypothetical protein [Deltaproteobacteria bacterium]
MLGLLDSFGVEFLVVGGLALAVHAEPRSTKDLDLWVRATPDNAERLFAALKAFGAPLHGATPSDFATPGIGLQLGVPPARIDLLTQIDGVEFAAAWPRRLAASFDGVPAPVISREDLLTNKRAAGRPQDLVDVDAVEAKAPRKKKRERSR